MIGDAAAQELYYMGTTETSTGSDEIINNTQSSMADLQILHKRELSLIELFKDNAYKLYGFSYTVQSHDHQNM